MLPSVIGFSGLSELATGHSKALGGPDTVENKQSWPLPARRRTYDVLQFQKVPPVAKHKTVTHLPAAPAPPAASAPRLLAQLLAVLGELVVAGADMVQNRKTA
jgi:hypothetical protein